MVTIVTWLLVDILAAHSAALARILDVPKTRSPGLRATQTFNEIGYDAAMSETDEERRRREGRLERRWRRAEATLF